MSRTEIYAFGKTTGEIIATAGVRNSHRGAKACWVYLEEKYLPPAYPAWSPDKAVSRVHMYDGDIQPILDLIEDDRVSKAEKICLISTFDYAFCAAENIPELIAAFRELGGENSFREQADEIQSLVDFHGSELGAIGWNQTSVCANPWCSEKECECCGATSSRDYNYHIDTKHEWMWKDGELDCKFEGTPE